MQVVGVGEKHGMVTSDLLVGYRTSVEWYTVRLRCEGGGIAVFVRDNVRVMSCMVMEHYVAVHTAMEGRGGRTSVCTAIYCR